MDKLSRQQRSEIMAAVKGKNTNPELVVRKKLHELGYRFRLHRRCLPGNPDIVLPKYRTCIFIHGCFWHQHPGCKRATVPSTNVEFWRNKFDQTKLRDQKAVNELKGLGWNACVIWECETKINQALNAAIRRCLPGTKVKQQ